MTAKQAFKLWYAAINAKQPKETTDAMFAEYMRIDRIEKETTRRCVRVETSYRRDGRAFRVAVYADGTTADLD